MCQYLMKFLPGFSDKIVSLRKLREKEHIKKWTMTKDDEFNNINTLLMNTRVLRYYGVDTPVLRY